MKFKIFWDLKFPGFKKGILIFLLLGALLFMGCMGEEFQPQGWSGPSVAEGILYVGSTKGKVVALDLSKRTKIWEFVPEETKRQNTSFGCAPSSRAAIIVYGTPAAAEGMVYFGSYSGKVYALDARTGAKKWEYPTGGAVIGSPVIAGDTLIVTSSDGKLYALDARSGGAKWAEPFATQGKIWADPVVANGKVYFGNFAHQFFAVDLKSGKLIWEREFKGAIASTPLVAEGTVYIGSFEGKLYALDAETGQPKWKEPFEAKNWFWTRPLFYRGTIYVGSLDHRVYALDAKTGKPKWPKPFETGGEIRSAPVIAGGVLIIASSDGKVYGLDPKTGMERWAPRDLLSPIFAYPWVNEDIVYIITQNNSLHAIKGETGEEIWSLTIE